MPRVARAADEFRSLACPSESRFAKPGGGSGLGDLTPASGEELAVFVLDRTGKLKLPETDYSASLIVVQHTSAAPVVMRVDAIDRAGASRPLFCGMAAPGTPYSILPKVGKPSHGDLLAVQIFDQPSENNEQERSQSTVDAAVATIVGALQVEERNEVRRRARLDRLLLGVRAEIASHPEQAISQLQAARKQLGQESTKYACGALSANSPPLFGPICDEYAVVSSQLLSVEAILAAAVASPPFRIPPNIAEALQKISVPRPRTASLEAQHCEGAKQLRWLQSQNAVRLIARAYLPFVDRDHLTHIRYGKVVEEPREVPTDGPLAFMVTDAPASRPSTFATKRGNVVTTDVAALLTKFLPAALGAIPSGLPKGRDGMVALDAAHPKERAPLPRQSLVCPDDKEEQLMVDLESVGKFETRTHIIGPISKKYAIDVAACEGSSCSTGVDDKSVKSRVAFRPSQAGTFMLLAEFAFNLGLGAAHSGDSAGLAGQTPPRFYPIEGSAGPEQLFQMRQEIDPRNAFSTALLLGYSLSDRCFVGAGPSLSVGASGALLKQWNLHGGFRLAPSTYLTFGPSVRFVPFPKFYEIGEVVPVARPSSGGIPAAPEFATDQTALWQLDLGLALDLAGAATAFGAFGGR